MAGWPHVVDIAAGLHRSGVPATPSSVMWRSGPATLQRYTSGDRASGTPVLMVHSLVTRSWVLDLAPGRSLIAALLAAGHDVYLLDWGIPGPAEAGRGFDDYAATLMLAEQVVRDRTGRPRVHLVGYCLGGTLALSTHAALGDTGLASLTAIAPSVDTAVDGRLDGILRSLRLPPVFALDGHGLVPAPLIRESFHWLHPIALRAARQVWRRRRNRNWRAVAGPLSRWVWEHTPFPGALLFDLVDYARGNALSGGRWLVHGRPARLESLEVPVLLAVAATDHIVPPPASLALVDLLRRPPRVVRCPGGHVAMLTGVGTRSILCRELLDFLATA
ncbi:alpha/beta fold hydrolase [Glycomyces luteolus]|uniref:Alpha/beta fold hydrolase n=1 Tax=Glycomyces luteolus TaxID=2670330 RepID=A0A9X3T247_9ACTN|nr:alpha/beta fold hydrolase [Glycomyces luteolus]MDA1358360.1 alpha/beta fold hydrolase [Glycomyces luteolus]